jgi:hypothetical protein
MPLAILSHPLEQLTELSLVSYSDTACAHLVLNILALAVVRSGGHSPLNRPAFSCSGS